MSQTVIVDTMVNQLEFRLTQNTTGVELLSEVARALMVREVWFFGLMWKGGENVWLKLDKKVTQQILKLMREYGMDKDLPDKKVNTLESPVLYFLIKYFPENVELEIIHDVTMKLLYLQVKELILKKEIKISEEKALVLASYAAVVSLGPFQKRFLTLENVFQEQMMPDDIKDQTIFNAKEATQKILSLFSEHNLMLREDAMKEYLRLAQELSMYGVEYYYGQNKNGTGLWLGVHALGINIYKNFDKENAWFTLHWSVIHHLYSRSNKFLIQSFEKHAPFLTLSTVDKRTSQQLLQACIGNHKLFSERRAGTYDQSLKRLKSLAQQEKAKSASQLESLKKEMEARRKVEEEKKTLEEELKEYQNDLKEALKELKRQKDMKKLLEGVNSEESTQPASSASLSKDLQEGAKGLSESELKRLSSELLEVRTRTHEVREDISQYEDRMSVFVAHLFKKHLITGTDDDADVDDVGDVDDVADVDYGDDDDVSTL